MSDNTAMSIDAILKSIEKKLSGEEHIYFLIHVVRYKKILEETQLIAKNRNLAILDIGCFPYHIGSALEFLGHTVYGISSPHESISQKNVVTLNIEKETFPFKNDMFDMVLFNEVLEHLPQSPLPVLREIERVVKKNGHLMITTPNIARSINRIKLLCGKTIMYPIDVYYENSQEGNVIYHRHNREYLLKEVTRLMQDTSWNITKHTHFISYTPFRKRAKPDSFPILIVKYVNYLAMRLFPSLGDTLLVIGRK